MTIRHTLLALVVIAAAGAASGGKAQNVDSPRQGTSAISTLRIAPLTGQGPVQSIIDLFDHRRFDAAIVPSDVLAYLREGHFSGAPSTIAYITKIDEEEVHILARQEIANIADLAGKKVNFDLRDTHSFVTGSVLFQALKINVQPVSLDPASAIRQLRQGEIAAIVHVAKSPARLFFNMNWDDRVHFLPVPFTQEVSRIYLPAILAPGDYPMLIRGGEAGRGSPVATVAVPIVLAVNSRTMNDQGNRGSSQPINAAPLASAPRPPSNPGSRPDPAMDVPGWRRIVPTESRFKTAMGAETGSRKMQSTSQTSAPNPHGEASARAPTLTDQQRRSLFRDFLSWRVQFTVSHKPPSGATEDVFGEFMRSLGSSSPNPH
jgi:uncharacterized protein